MLLLRAGTALAADPAAPPYTHEALVDVPEPLLLDLIRRPDARAGEVEVNTLVLVPLRRRPRVAWAPELEVAFARGHAAELEVDLDDARVERVQLGVQGTLGAHRSQRLLHGWQVLVAYDLVERAVVSTWLYLGAVRWTRRLSSWLILGPRLVGPAEAAARVELVASSSLYLKLSRDVTVGIELNLGHGPDETSLLLLPQLEWDVTGSLQLQVGVGPRFERARTVPVLAVRLTWDRD